MYPILLDLSILTILVIGSGREATRRIGLLDEASPRDLRVFSDDPSPELVAAAGDRLTRRLPRKRDIPPRSILFVGDLPDDVAAKIIAKGRARGALVNVEDKTAFCDFHSGSTVRRGDLLLTISTGGHSPGLAARLRRHFETAFGPEWADRLRELGQLRRAWRAEGADFAEVKRRTSAVIDGEAWLDAIQAADLDAIAPLDDGKIIPLKRSR